MINRIRDVRRQKGLTLAAVAARCTPPTTAQTIGRLETGTRTLSLNWLNRIADALEVESEELLQGNSGNDMPIAAELGPDGARALKQPSRAVPPMVPENGIAMTVAAGLGDYRAGDTIWLKQLSPENFASALNRDVLVPRSNGRFFFGRIIGHDAGQILILPLGAGQRQQVVKNPPWIGCAELLIRNV